MKSLYEIKWNDDSTGAPVCVHIFCVCQRCISTHSMHEMLFGLAIYFSLCVYKHTGFDCHANVYLPIKLRTKERITLALAFRVSQTWAGTIYIRVISVSHENFFTVWIEDCQNHRQMKRSLSTSPSSLIFASTRPTPEFVSVFISQL